MSRDIHCQQINARNRAGRHSLGMRRVPGDLPAPSSLLAVHSIRDLICSMPASGRVHRRQFRTEEDAVEGPVLQEMFSLSAMPLPEPVGSAKPYILMCEPVERKFA